MFKSITRSSLGHILNTSDVYKNTTSYLRTQILFFKCNYNIIQQEFRQLLVFTLNHGLNSMLCSPAKWALCYFFLNIKIMQKSLTATATMTPISKYSKAVIFGGIYGVHKTVTIFFKQNRMLVSVS